MVGLVSDPNKVARLAAQKEDENWAFRAWLKGEYDYDDEQLMLLVRELAAQVSSQIDCTKCANCCRQLDAYLEDKDVERLARALEMTLSAFRTMYLLPDVELGEKSWYLPAPCPLLDGNLCRVYAARPEECRGYPHLSADFVAHSIRRIQGTFVCPIVFNVVEGMKEVLDWRS
jgi:Fe-S-cluster containining protein